MGKILTVTNILIVLIIFSFILEILFPGYTEALWFFIGLATTEPWRLFTSAFVHLGLLHLLLNIYALFIFGNLLEERIPKRDFLALFFIGNIVSSLSDAASGYLGLEALRPLAGASGAGSAILAACFFLMSKTNVNVFLINMKVRTVLVIFLMEEFLAVSGIFNLLPNAAHYAHFGALCFGYLYAKFFIKVAKV